MATRTFQIMMFVKQRIFGLLVVVEGNFLPGFFNMAGLTLGTKVTLVLVIFFVA